MKVVYFQAQSRDPIKIHSMLREIDPMCPTPQALEGGDGNGGLWQCMLALHKKDALRYYDVTILGIFTTDVEDNLYSPENFVKWVWGGLPILVKRKDM